MHRSTLTSRLFAAGLAAVFAAGCSSSETTPPPAAPVISTQPVSATVVAGAPATFTVAATSSGTLSYQWRKDGAAVAGASAATLSFAAVTADDIGVYDCLVTGTTNGVAQVAVSSGATLSVNVSPAIGVQPAAQSVQPGGQVVFMVGATGNGTVSYQWKKDGVDILGATGPTYTIAAATAADAGDYTCVVTNKMGSTTTTTVTAAGTLTVNAASPTAPSITTQPAAVTVADGGDASFTVAATGNGTLSYQWRKNGALKDGATSATLSMTGVTAADAGVYDCVVTNTSGGKSAVAISTGAILSINGAPVILAHPANATAILNGSATFTVVASGSGTLTYQWRKDGNAIDSATSSSLALSSIAAADAASYDVIVTNTVGATHNSTTSSAATLTIATSPLITDQSGAQVLAVGGNATFHVTATGTGLTYQWYRGSTAVANGDEFAGATTNTLTITGVSMSDAGNYSCIVTSTQGAAVTTGTSNAAALVVVATPVITAHPAAITVAEGDAGDFSVSATSANGALSYQWQLSTDGGTTFADVAGATSSDLHLTDVGAANAGTYRCVVTNTIAGVASPVPSNAASLTLNTSLIVNAQPASATIVGGNDADLFFDVSAASGATVTYQWKKDGTAIVGATDAHLVLTGVTIADDGSYTCDAKATMAGTHTATITSSIAVVAVNVAPTITVLPTAQFAATGASSTATFSVTATSVGTTQYKWFKVGVTNPVSTASTYTTGNLTDATLDGSQYTVTVTSKLGATSVSATATDPVSLTVAVTPVVTLSGPASLNFQVGDAAPTLTANVAATGQPTGVLTYQWKRGTGTSAVAIVGANGPTYTLLTPMSVANAGSYTCTVTNTYNGAAGTATAATALAVNVFAPPVFTKDLPPAAYLAVASYSKTAPPTLSSSSFSVTATNTATGGTLSYVWQSSPDLTTWTNVSGGPNTAGYAAVAYPITAPAGDKTALYYRVQVTNTLSPFTPVTITSSPSYVTIYQTVGALPALPATVNVTAGSTVNPTVAPVGITVAGTTQSFQWFKTISPTATAGVAVSGATSAGLNIASAAGSDAGNYYVVVTNTPTGFITGGTSGSNTATSSVVRVNVNTVPAIVTQPIAAPIATEGQPFTQTVVASAATGADISYQWRKNGANIAGAIGPNYTLAAPGAGDAGSYDVVVTSNLPGTTAQAVTSAAAALTVNLKPVSLTPVVTGDAVNGPVTLTINADNSANPGATLTYQWRRNGAVIAGATSLSYSIPAPVISTSAGNYTCDVSSVYAATANSNASTATATSPAAVVGVGGAAVQVTMASTVTTGKSVAISTPSIAGATYEWTVTNITGNVTGQGKNAVTVTAGNNLSLPMVATVVVSSNGTVSVGTASATVVASANMPAIVTPTNVHPGDNWMIASIDNQGATYSWSVSGVGSVANGTPTNGLTLPFSANSGATNGTTIPVSAIAANAAGDSSFTSIRTVNVTTGTWISKDVGSKWMLGAAVGGNANLNTPASAAVVLPNGRVLVCGGMAISSFASPASAIYDPATQRWTRVADMNFTRTGHTATLLPNGTVLVVGGISMLNGAPVYSANAELYDPVNNFWLPLTSNVLTSRAAHTATLMTAGANAGKVVIIGGKASNVTNDWNTSIVIFTPSGAPGANANGTFALSPAVINVPRDRHTATALADGRVLVVGGMSPTIGGTSESFTQAEIFDATTGTQTMSRVGQLMNGPRLYHSATLMADGRVLIAGGNQTGAVNTAEIFDPTTGIFSAVTNTMKGGALATNTAGRNMHAGVLLTAGPNANKVLLIGGNAGNTQGGPQSAELFDPGAGTPGAGTFTNVTSMNTGRWLFNAVTLNDGRVMVMGGNTPNIPTATTEIFNPSANAGNGSWTLVGAPGRTAATLTRLYDGRIMLVGGINEIAGTVGGVTQTTSNTTHIYDPATGTWTDGPNLLQARALHSAVLLANHKVLVAGGTTSPGQSASFATTEIWDPANPGVWTSAGNMKSVRQGFGLIALPDGRALAMGGNSGGATTATTELFDPAAFAADPANGWAYTNNGTQQTTLSEAKNFFTPVLVTNGSTVQVIVAGGNTTGSSTATNTVDAFDPVTQNWTPLNPLAQARTQFFAFGLPNGRIVLLGGKFLVTGPLGSSLTAAGVGTADYAVEIYDTTVPANGSMGVTIPTTNHFFKTEARFIPTTNSSSAASASVLPGGKIMLMGGSLNGITGLATSEIYDPATDALTVGPTLYQGPGLMAVPLGNPTGDVMVYGGQGSDSITQIYRPQ